MHIKETRFLSGFTHHLNRGFGEGFTDWGRGFTHCHRVLPLASGVLPTGFYPVKRYENKMFPTIWLGLMGLWHSERGAGSGTHTQGFGFQSNGSAGFTLTSTHALVCEQGVWRSYGTTRSHEVCFTQCSVAQYAIRGQCRGAGCGAARRVVLPAGRVGFTHRVLPDR